MPEAIVWNSGFSVGHPVLDEQHQDLLKLVNQLVGCMNDSSEEGTEAFHATLNDISSLARAHFQAEERIISRWDDSFLKEQQAECEEYEERLTQHLFSATFGTVNKVEICQYVSEWWLRHIQETATHLKQAMQRRGAI